MKHTRNKKVAKYVAAQRGIDRDRHFQSGGGTCEWVGSHKVHDSTPRRIRTRASNKRRALLEGSEG